MKTFVVFAAVMAVVVALPQFEQPSHRPPFPDHQAQVRPPNHQPPPQHPAPQVPHHHGHGHGQDVVVVKETPSNNNGLGGYYFAYEQSDGQRREESAEFVPIHEDQQAMRVKGSYSWVDPVTKQTYIVNYEADEYGFRPHAVHLPA